MLSAGQYSNAQKNSGLPEKIEYTREARFIHEAPVLLAALLRDGKSDQVRNFIENWKKSDAPSDELIFSISALLSIQNGNFSMLRLPCDAFYFLEDYARELREIDEGSPNFRYYIRISGTYSYDATADARRLLFFARSWARQLIADGQLDKTEWFLCNVFSGDIRHPTSAFRRDKEAYTGLTAFQHAIDGYFISRRNKNAITLGIMTGVWVPAGNLKTLGVHPSVGLLIGGRNKMNEYDVVWSFRFLNPTPRNYTVSRNDTLHTDNYYDGGYIGFDYTRYVLRKTRFELGIISAVGYDYFSVANGWGGDTTHSDLVPFNIGSFDFSNGFRLKYFFRRGPGSFIGLAAKYHMINYCNRGGTDLGGNAFTIDIVYGSR
jgi:hypothetical protein